MKIDIADLFLYAVIAGLFFFTAGIIAQSTVVSVVGLLIIVGLAGVVVAFANKDFHWFDRDLNLRPKVVYVDRPREQVAPVQEINRYPSRPERFYQEPVYAGPDDIEEEYDDDVDDDSQVKKPRDPFVDLDAVDNWGFLD